VRTFLLFGSTGDGWELSEAEMADLFGFFVAEAARLDLRFLIGVLRPEASETRSGIEAALRRIRELAGTADDGEALRRTGVCGFTVCAPRGADLSQAVMARDFSGILDLGQPTALYQLPQVTQNEFSPGTFSVLAEKYPNFYLMKDTSGNDTVVKSRAARNGIFMVRGGEGDYEAWYPENGGEGYDGFLLGSANCFARELKLMQALKDGGQKAAARELSDRLSRTVQAGLDLAAPLPFGNAFANANKAFDHFFAHGKGAADKAPPMTHSGQRLPETLIRAAGELLEREGLMAEEGYLRP
jgi:dihydrodipicolinate synthase/N-acetylneuraminate lyase